MAEYKLSLTDFQLAIILDTVKGFVDNNKLIHVPLSEGGMAGLPLTEEALEWMLEAFDSSGIKDVADYMVTVEAVEQGPANVIIDCPTVSQSYHYTANLADFDEQ